VVVKEFNKFSVRFLSLDEEPIRPIKNGNVIMLSHRNSICLELV
jgi:hypothetical protein